LLDAFAGASPPLKKYLDPDFVTTTFPPTAFPLMGEVVTGSPSLKALDPLMTPEMDPSGDCFHLEMTGTPRGAAEVAAGADLSGSSPPPNPNNEMVGERPVTGAAAACGLLACLDLTGAGATLSSPPPSPNKEIVGDRLFTGATGAASALGLLACLALAARAAFASSAFFFASSCACFFSSAMRCFSANAACRASS